MAKPTVSRRNFLAASSLAAPAYALCRSAIGGELAAGEKIESGDRRHEEPLPFLMADDFEELDFMAWRVEPGKPDPHNPLLEPEMPWDNGGIFGHGTVLRDPIDGLWKAWQVSMPAPEPSKFDSRWFQARITYLESDDGVRWRRPRLKHIPWPGHDETNIVVDIWSTYASVSVNPANKELPYEMTVFRHANYLGSGSIAGLPLPPGATTHPPGLYRYQSPDGKDWKPVEGPLKLETNDSCYVYRFGEGSYVCYHKTEMPAFPGGLTPFDVADGGVRLIGRRTSTDGVHWSDPTQIVLAPDWRDPQDTQFMELCPLEVPGGLAASLTVYHNMTQTIDLQWACSRDGVAWWRPERRPSLANAALGEYGGGMIWPMRQPVRDGNLLHVYYAGTEGLHGDLYNTASPGRGPIRARGERLSRQSFTYGGDYSALCRATWELDRLWALAPCHGGYTEGLASMRPAELAGKQLVVNATSRPGGRLRVELLDADRRAIPGFTAADCQPIAGDEHRAVVTWTGGAAAPVAAVRTRILLKRAFLWGMEWQAKA